jgi:hypothetical protein
VYGQTQSSKKRISLSAWEVALPETLDVGLKPLPKSAPNSSEGLNSEPIIHRVPESLFASQIFFRRLHRYMPEKKLDLLQFASRIVTEPSTRPSEIVWREL